MLDSHLSTYGYLLVLPFYNSIQMAEPGKEQYILAFESQRY